MARVFISFVHEDRDVAEAVQALLSKELGLGKDVFLSADQSQVLAGDIWFDKIRDALESCGVLVLLLSGRAMRRPWVSFEAGAVWLSKRPVIPVCIGNTSKDGLPQPYAGMQALNLPDDVDYLIKSVYGQLELEMPPPMPSRLRRRMNEAVRESSEGNRYQLAALQGDPYNLLDTAFAKWQDEPRRRRLPPDAT